LIEKIWRPNRADVPSSAGLDFDTDHYLVVVKDIQRMSVNRGA